MPFPLTWRFVAILSLLALPRAGGTQGSDMVSFHSANGDQVDMVAQPQEHGAPTRDKIRLCFENPTNNRNAKGFGNRPDHQPDIVTPPGQTGCMYLSPVRQTLVFWVRSPEGGFDIAMMTSLDLRRKLGTVYFLRWSKEQPA